MGNRPPTRGSTKGAAAPVKRRPSKKRAAPKEEGVERLHVRIARSGLCSRRAAEKLIEQGRVEVNGDLVVEMGRQVTPEDEVRVDGTVVSEAKHFTLVLNKPKGVVTTLRDPQGRPTIKQFLPDIGVQLKPVGRLDMETEGLIVLTNDGDLAHRLSHPRYGVEKEYFAIVRGIPDEKALGRLRDGIHIEGGKTAPAVVEINHAEPKANTTSLKLVLHEGRKRQVRLMCEAVGHPVISLKRVRYAFLSIKGLRAGEARMLGKKELDELKQLVGL